MKRDSCDTCSHLTVHTRARIRHKQEELSQLSRSRRAVEMLLNDTEWSQWSNAEISRRCHVNSSTVDKYRLRQDASSGNRKIADPRKVQRGETIYTQRTENIGRRAVEPSAPASKG